MGTSQDGSEDDERRGRPNRAVHKARTRQALLDAALELFATEGYDATTTEAIAERAGVSPRTFFRYFPTKESVLFIGEHDYLRSFVAVYLAQPATTGELEAMRASFLVLAPRVARLRRRIQRYQQAISSSPVLRGREQEHHAANVADLAGALATRRALPAPDERCQLLAVVGLGVLRRALDRWLEAPGRPDLAAFIDEEFELLVELATDGG